MKILKGLILVTMVVLVLAARAARRAGYYFRPTPSASRLTNPA